MEEIRVAIITLGCAKNEVDSRQMRERIASAGFSITEEPEEAQAIIVNTCAFIQSATEESLSLIFEMADLPQVLDGDAKIVVAGCMPSRYGSDLQTELHEADAFVPCSKEDDIVGILESLFPQHIPCETPSVLLGEISSYVKISDGCDRYCSYCAIPYIRGRYHSFSASQIHSEVASSVASGAREIVLIAQDTGRWGSDLEPESTLAQLMDGLAHDFPQTWFRVMYLQPEGVTDELLTVMARNDNICDYLDIPFQHCDKRILHLMNRRGSATKFLQLVDHIRSMIPTVTLRTTLIAGFPGETEDEFQSLLDFVEDIDFDYVGVFPYSQEEGTKAAGLPDQIDEDEKIARAQSVRDVADAISCGHVAKRVGSSMPVLVLGSEEDGQLFGRAQCQAPDVDGVVYVCQGEPGQIMDVLITDTLAYEMEGE